MILLYRTGGSWWDSEIYSFMERKALLHIGNMYFYFLVCERKGEWWLYLNVHICICYSTHSKGSSMNSNLYIKNKYLEHAIEGLMGICKRSGACIWPVHWKSHLSCEGSTVCYRTGINLIASFKKKNPLRVILKSIWTDYILFLIPGNILEY